MQQRRIAEPADLPPLKWSSLKYDFDGGGYRDGEEEAYGGRDRCEASAGRCADGAGAAGGGRGPSDRCDGGYVLSVAQRVRGSKGDQVKRLKELETENGRLRRAVSDLTLDKMILTEAARGNF